jgi:hypothetical protein
MGVVRTSITLTLSQRGGGGFNLFSPLPQNEWILKLAILGTFALVTCHETIDSEWFGSWKKYLQKNAENPPAGITRTKRCGKRGE